MGKTNQIKGGALSVHQEDAEGRVRHLLLSLNSKVAQDTAFWPQSQTHGGQDLPQLLTEGAES